MNTSDRAEGCIRFGDWELEVRERKELTYVSKLGGDFKPSDSFPDGNLLDLKHEMEPRPVKGLT